jgi:hypothetical protein
MAEVNYIKQLTEVMGKFSDDDRLNPSHVSLYLGLFMFWNSSRFKNPISISRSEIMKVSKIGSNATYHRCITDLHKWNYLEYLPSHNPFKGSKVNMFIFETGAEQVLNENRSKNEHVSEQAVNGNHSKIEQVPEQALVPYINLYKHNKLYKQERGEEKKSSLHSSQNKNTDSSFCKADLQSSKKNDLQSSDSPKSKKVSKGELHSPTRRKKFVPPELKEVKIFFHENKSSYQVGETFYNHFESNGWLVGGKAKMKNWKAAARNWISREEKYQAKSRSPAQQRLHVNENKDYDIPL